MRLRATMFAAAALIFISSGGSLFAQSITLSSPTNFGTGQAPYSVAAADLNGNGKPDLIVANNTAATISVLMDTTAANSATPYFLPKVDFPVGPSPYAVATGDFNGDGKPDVVVTNSGDNTISVLLNKTATDSMTPAFYDTTNFQTGTTPQVVAVADINGDGRPDIITANYTGSAAISVFLNTTTPGDTIPSFSGPFNFDAGGNDVGIDTADVNSDGKVDIIVGNFSSANSTVSVLLNETPVDGTTPVFTTPVNFPVGAGVHSVATADVNGDTKPDIITVGFYSDSVSVLLNTTSTASPDTTPSFSAYTNFALPAGYNPNMAKAADLNSDGKPDIIVGYYQTMDSISVLQNQTTTGASIPSFGSSVQYATPGVPFAIGVADINNDGKPDVLAASQDKAEVTAFLNAADKSLNVEVGSFKATSSYNSVTLTWQTQSEVSNAGFNIYREKQGSSYFSLIASYTTDDSLVGMGTSSAGRSYDFTDGRVVSGDTYVYRIQSVSTNGTTKNFTSLSVTVGVPSTYALYQNYPNPFNPSTTIQFDLKETSSVTIGIYNILGQRVLEQNYGVMNAGRYEKSINLDNFATGTYFYRINAVGNDGKAFTSVRKMLLLK